MARPLLWVLSGSLLFLSLALDNGLGLTPALGFSSWNAFSADVNTTLMRAIVKKLQDTGLGDKGFVYINIDEGWLADRDSSNNIVDDRKKFPEGMKAFGDWVHSQETSPGSGKFFKYGLYTCRGTCQCSEPDYHGPGSQGFEAQDVAWMVDAGADYLKVDSCCASQDHKTAFTQYGLFRDALNASGRPVYFSLCGWNSWYAPPDPSVSYAGGYSLGNSWRIAGDGDTWPALTNCFNTVANIRQYAGAGGWNDPDLLIGPNGVADGTYATDLQARTQVNLWSVIGAPLLISNNLLQASQYNVDSYGNEEVIAVDQDPAAIPGYRIVGGDLTFPCNGALPEGALYTVSAQPCDASDPLQKWVRLPNGTLQLSAERSVTAVVDVWTCATKDGSPLFVGPSDGTGGSCGGANQAWTWGADGTLRNNHSGTCLDVYNRVGPAMDVWTCNGGDNQQWTLTADGHLQSQQALSPPLCMAARKPAPGACSNVWGRPLADGSWAVAFVNNGPGNATVTCDAACFGFMNLTATAATLSVRDLWAHAVVATLTPPFSYTALVEGAGGSVIVRAIPA